MAVDDPNVIDNVSAARDGRVTLSISDHLPWDAEKDHLLKLQAKLNRYLDFLKGGELVQQFPQTAGKPVLIRVFFMHYPPPPAAEHFLSRVAARIEKEGFSFSHCQMKLPG